MEISFDPVKNARNIHDRGLSFDLAAEFDFATATIALDVRYEYGETRYVAIGYLDARLHILCFVETEKGIRVISFRRANEREVKRYEKTQTPNR